MQKRRQRFVACLLVLAMALQLAACGAAEKITLNRSTVTVKVGQTAQLEYKLTPEDAKDSVTFVSENEQIATVSPDGLITGVAEGETVVTVSAENVSATCAVTVESAAKEYDELESVNGFKAFPRGGLIGGEGGTYYPVETTPDGDNAVTFRGKGGLSWPDTVNMAKPSAMGGYYESALPLDNLTLTWRLDTPMDTDLEHWYAIALEDRNQLFNDWDGEDPTKTLFFMIGFGENMVYLMPHYRDVMELGEAWSYLGSSQGVPYQEGDTLTIQMVKLEEGYVVYLNGVCQYYSNIKTPYLYIIDDLFPNEEVWPMAVAHIGNPEAQYEEEYAFTFGLGEPATDLLAPGDAGIEPKSITLNGFTTFPYGGMVGGRTYNNDITLNDCGTTDRVKVTGYGGTNYNDPLIPRSTMGVYSEEKYKLENLEILYSVEDWIQSTQDGDSWYAIALSPENGKWFENDGTENALFFLFGYENGTVNLMAHYVGDDDPWTYLGKSQGVPAVGGQYSIFLQKVDGGYSVYMRNAEQSNYVLQSFDGETVLPEELFDTLLPDDEAYLMAGGYAATYEGAWSFIIGARENASLAARPVRPTGGNGGRPAAKQTVNGFTAYRYGGLINRTTYNNNITLNDCGSTDMVKVSGHGGTNYGDPTTPRSTMGVYSEQKYDLDGLEILYSVEDWVQSGNHWYAIALTENNGEWFENDGSDKALFFMFAYDNGMVSLTAHHIGNGAGWTNLGTSQGVPAAPGQYSIYLQKVDGGYCVYMKNSQQSTYTLQSFGGMTVLPDSIVEGLFPNGSAYLTAGAYVETYAGEWSFILGAHEHMDYPVSPEPPVPTEPESLNGFTAYANGGLINCTVYDPNIELGDCGSTDRVSVTGCGGTNYGDTTHTRSTMGVYSEEEYDIDGLEVLYSVEEWVQSGNHWYAIALTENKGEWFENDGSDKALFFMFAYDNGYVTLNAHHIGNGAGWTSLGMSQGVPAAGGQYSIYIKKVDGGYSVYMKNAEQSEYTLQSFGGMTVIPDEIVEGLFPSGSAYLTAGAYVETYTGEWSFILGAHEHMDYPVDPETPIDPDPPIPAEPETLNGFTAYANGGLVGGTTYDPDIELGDCGSTDRVSVTGCGGTNYGDTTHTRSTMGVYSEEEYDIDGLEILYSVEEWIQSGDHWYAIAMTENKGEWFENDGSDKALFFMFAYDNGYVTLNAHHIGNGAGWTSLGTSQGVPAVGGQYSIYLKKVDGGYCVYMKNAEQSEYTLQSFGDMTVIPDEIVEGLFPSGSAYLTAGAYVATYEGEWSFVLGAHENMEYDVPLPTPPTPPTPPDEPNTLNGFTAYENGGLVGGTTYDPDIELGDCDSTDRVSVTGCGGTNYGDTTSTRSTMGVYSEEEYDIDGLEILYSVEEWIQSGDHWYAIALTENKGEWFENDGSDKALFFMFAYDNGMVTLTAHHIGNGAGWTTIGTSQGIPAVGGQYSIYLKKVDGGYCVYMKNAEQSEYTLLEFGDMTVIPDEIVSGLFPSGSAYLTAGAYVATYEGEWSFVLGAHENMEYDVPLPTPPVETNTLNGFTAYENGGLVGGTAYDPEITLGDCGSTDRVSVTGRGGTNYGDTTQTRSTMGVYSEQTYDIDGLEILYSVESWIQSGDHWYAIALTENKGEWFENDGSDKALFFMFAYNNGYVTLNAHHIGNGAGWTSLGTSQGVPAVGGQYSIYLKKIDGGYAVYMKNAEQSEYTLQEFGGMKILPASIVEGLFPSGSAYLTAGAYVATYDGQWSFILGTHENMEYDVPDPNPTVDVQTVNGFSAFATGGLVGGTTYDADIQLNDCGSSDRVKATGRGGTNYGDTTHPRSTMGVYSTRTYAINNLEILYSVEDWVQSGDHWYAFALTRSNDHWFENNGSDCALFFMFGYENGSVVLQAHHIGNGAGWSFIGKSQGVPAAGGQYSIVLKKTDGGYSVYMKNASQTEYTLQSFGSTTVIPESIVNGLFPSGSAYLMAGAYVATYDGTWSFILGAHENVSVTLPQEATVTDEELAAEELIPEETAATEETEETEEIAAEESVKCIDAYIDINEDPVQIPEPEDTDLGDDTAETAEIPEEFSENLTEDAELPESSEDRDEMIPAEKEDTDPDDPSSEKEEEQ